MKYGIQLYSVRDLIKNDFTGTLEEVAQMPLFQGLEFAFVYEGMTGGMTPAELAAYLKKFNWEVSGIFGHLKDYGNPESDLYKYLEALDCNCLIVGSYKEDKLENSFDDCITELHEACAVSTAKNINVAYHGHPWEYIAQADGSCYMERMMQEVPELKFVPDLAWIYHGGQDVIKFMEQYVDRTPIIHLKDSKADKTITELGNGIIDMPAVIDFAAANNIEWLNYEQDYFEASCLEGARASHDYLNKIVNKIL